MFEDVTAYPTLPAPSWVDALSHNGAAALTGVKVAAGDGAALKISGLQKIRAGCDVAPRDPARAGTVLVRGSYGPTKAKAIAEED